MNAGLRLTLGMGAVAFVLALSFGLAVQCSPKPRADVIQAHYPASIYIIAAHHLPPGLDGHDCYSLSYSVDGAAYYVNMDTSKELWDFLGELKNNGALRGSVDQAYALTTR